MKKADILIFFFVMGIILIVTPVAYWFATLEYPEFGENPELFVSIYLGMIIFMAILTITILIYSSIVEKRVKKNTKETLIKYYQKLENLDDDINVGDDSPIDIEIQSRSYMSLNRLSIQETNKGNHLKALALNKRALEIKPNKPELFLNKCYIYTNMSQINKAITSCLKGLEINASFMPLWDSLATGFKEKKDYDTAILACKDALKIKSNYALGFNNLAYFYYLKGDYDRAYSNCNKALLLNNTFDLAWATMSEIYNAKNNYDKAIEASKRAIQLNPKIKEAWYNLGLGLYKKGETDHALKSLENALIIDLNYSEALNLQKTILEN